MTEHPQVVAYHGKPVVLLGQEVRVGDYAPNFRAVGRDFAMMALSDFAGRPRLISSVFSLETGICSEQTRRIDQALATLAENAVAVIVSMDTPFAQSRFRESAGVRNTQIVSDMVWREFGLNYGVLVKDLGMLARSLWVVSAEGRVVHKEIVPEIAQHPDYEEAFQKLRRL